MSVGGASSQPPGKPCPPRDPPAREVGLRGCPLLEGAPARDQPDHCVQVMLLETSRRYNPGSESITFLKDFSYNREDFAKAGED